jgi:hypothetical protein
MIDDHQLQQHVVDEHEFEPRVNAAHIGVAAKSGVVTLTGFVASYAEKFAAEAAVRRVKGVRAIAEEIDVRLPMDKKRADDEIAERAVRILHWDDLNADPKPFRWTKSADDILASIERFCLYNVPVDA